MSSQKGNVSRSRGQKHQNATAYRNDKYGATAQVKMANAKVHEGLCQHCKGVLEWKVKYKKYKTLTQAKKCVKCSEKSVKDAYHIICKPCSLQLEICCKCGKKEDIIIPINKSEQEEEEEEDKDPQKGCGRGKKDMDSDDDDDDDDEEDSGDLEDEDDKNFDSDSNQKKTQTMSAALPDVSSITVK